MSYRRRPCGWTLPNARVSCSTVTEASSCATESEPQRCQASAVAPGPRRGAGQSDVLEREDARGCGHDVVHGVHRGHRGHGVPFVIAPGFRRYEADSGAHLGFAVNGDVVVVLIEVPVRVELLGQVPDDGGTQDGVLADLGAPAAAQRSDGVLLDAHPAEVD